MSQPDDARKLELHLFSHTQCAELTELLTVTAHYHRTGCSLDLGHTVNFGRPWVPGSRCSQGLVSLPYLDGPALERLEIAQGVTVSFLWLIPITPDEVIYKQRFGADALENCLEASRFDYCDPYRASAVDPVR